LKNLPTVLSAIASKKSQARISTALTLKPWPQSITKLRFNYTKIPWTREEKKQSSKNPRDLISKKEKKG